MFEVQEALESQKQDFARKVGGRHSLSCPDYTSSGDRTWTVQHKPLPMQAMVLMSPAATVARRQLLVSLN
jgi:hypothetical protein